MEESSSANGSAPVRALTHTHDNNPHPVLAKYYNTISSRDSLSTARSRSFTTPSHPFLPYFTSSPLEAHP